MDELQGLNFIDDNGNFKGIIERNFYGNNCHKHIIHYQDENLNYQTEAMDNDKFTIFARSAKLKSERYSFIKSRGIGHIYHLSPIANTKSILEYGILSREFANLISLPIIATDPLRLDGELDKISASISFPNYKMRYTLEKRDRLTLTMYDISPRLLLTKLDTQFYHTNAANAIFYDINKSILTKNEALIGMFSENNRDTNLHSRFTTDPQAEILVDHSIPKQYIKRVITKYPNRDIKNLCDEKEFTYECIPDLYAPRMDYRRW